MTPVYEIIDAEMKLAFEGEMSLAEIADLATLLTSARSFI